MPQTIQVWLEDKPGALMRVAGVITAKGCNIDSLTLVPDPCQAGVSRMTIVAATEPRLRQRVVNEMNRLVNVLLAVEVSDQSRGCGTPPQSASARSMRQPEEITC